MVNMYESGKGYKAISKALGLQRTMVRAIIHKLRKIGTVVNLPRWGQPTKITPREQQRLIQEVIKEPRTTSKELQVSLASIKVSVHDSTIRKRLGKNGINGRVPRQKPLLTTKKEHKGSSHIISQKILKENVRPSVCDLYAAGQNSPASPLLNGSIKTKLRFWGGQVKLRT